MDWTGYTIEADDATIFHKCRITNRWKPDKYADKWWWKCVDCNKSSGVFSDSDLRFLKSKGFIKPPHKSDKDLTGNTAHPDESGKNEYGRYGYYGGYD